MLYSSLLYRKGASDNSAYYFVTDSNPLFMNLIREVLIDAGYHNAVAYVGDNAFQRIRDEQPALVLLDITVMDPGRAWSILDLLRLHPQTRTIPFILCSTEMRLLEEKAELLRELHCRTLEKPFDIETLLETVAAAIGPPPTT